MVSAAALTIAAVLMAMQFRQVKPEYGTYISIAAGLLIFGLALTKVSVVIESIKKITSFVCLDSKYVRILLKVAGVAYICEYSSNLSRDCGYTSIAGQIEMAGKLTILVMSMPVVMALIDTINRFL